MAASTGKSAVVKAVCIQGGPVSCVEALAMPGIIQESLAELKIRGVPYGKIELAQFPDLHSFNVKLKVHAKVCAKFDAAQCVKDAPAIEEEQENQMLTPLGPTCQACQFMAARARADIKQAERER